MPDERLADFVVRWPGKWPKGARGRAAPAKATEAVKGKRPKGQDKAVVNSSTVISPAGFAPQPAAARPCGDGRLGSVAPPIETGV